MKTLRLTSVALLAAAAAFNSAARTAADFFASAPDAVIRLLPQSTRLDMLDYFRFGSKKTSPNHLGGQAAVTAEETATVNYSISDRANGQIAMLTTRKDTILAVVTTVLTPLPDSSIEWFRADWTPAPPPVAMPRYSDWLTDEGRQSTGRATEIVPFMLVKATFDPGATLLTLTNAARDFVAPELRDEADRLIIREKSYAVKGTKLSAQ